MSTAITLVSSAGQLRGLHDPPAGPAPARGPLAAVVCHPHPEHGGTMDNKVVHGTAKTLAACGLAVVRFNFRGAGGSEGRHEGGTGERDDVRAALDHAASLVGGRVGPGPGRLLMAGFSFGSWVGLSVGAEDERVGALLAIAPPVNHYDYSFLQRSTLPLALIYAAQDELVPAAAVEAFVARLPRPPQVTAVDGSGHLFHGRQQALRAAVAAFCARLGAPG